MKTHKLLVCLDTLMDTRLGTLATIDPQVATKVATNPKYWTRLTNDWTTLTAGQVTTEQFNERYARRDVEVLQNSIVSGMTVFMLRLLAENAKNNREAVHAVELVLEVNIWPYELLPDEVEELELQLHRYFGESLPICFVSVPLKCLTPAYIREHYGAVICYNFHEWIKLHSHAIYEARTPDLNFVAPKLFENDISAIDSEGIEEELIKFKVYWLEYIDFDFVDLIHWSMFRPEPEYKAEVDHPPTGSE